MSDQAMKKWTPALVSALVLGVFALIGSTLVGLSYVGTTERIAQSQRDSLMAVLGQLIPHQRYDNDMLTDTTTLDGIAALGGQKVTVYRARLHGRPVAAVFSPVISSGYAGPIKLIIGIYADGRMAGVRILSQNETPGLGDKIQLSHTRWVLQFNGKSLGHPPASRWKVKRDGGIFDQFSGATITPRLVVATITSTLTYFDRHQTRVFATGPDPDSKAAE